ncbi:MAG: carbonate dehydratase, partial [Casimicrobiaceae bacterium]
MPTLPELFDNNRRWAEGRLERDPDFFTRLADQQAPRYMWIGCSDSRVPANEIIGLPPGDVFVHRNIANVVVHSDLNCLSVLQFAIDRLGVTDVIVCGHYGCSGVRAAMSGERVGLAEHWLMHVRDVGRQHRKLIEAQSTDEAKLDRLAEVNVLSQLANVCRTRVVRDAWTRGQKLTIHGWIYGLHDGLLRDLGVEVSGHDELGSALDSGFAR